jgi:hypothetical protein
LTQLIRSLALMTVLKTWGVTIILSSQRYYVPSLGSGRGRASETSLEGQSNLMLSALGNTNRMVVGLWFAFSVTNPAADNWKGDLTFPFPTAAAIPGVHHGNATATSWHGATLTMRVVPTTTGPPARVRSVCLPASLVLPRSPAHRHRYREWEGGREALVSGEKERRERHRKARVRLCLTQIQENKPPATPASSADGHIGAAAEAETSGRATRSTETSHSFLRMTTHVRCSYSVAFVVAPIVGGRHGGGEAAAIFESNPHGWRSEGCRCGEWGDLPGREAHRR